MYIRRVDSEEGYRYMLRESYRDGGLWKHKDLLDLGASPEDHIEYPGGNGFYFTPALEEMLERKGVNYSTEELEEAFLPYLEPHVREVIGKYLQRGPSQRRWKSMPQEDLANGQRALHTFDKRRLHFLRCGRVDIGSLEDRPWKFLNVLLGMSRDEIEHTIEGMERVLRPHEMRSYIFTALHLQVYFPEHPMRNHPVGLDAERVDECFLEEVCRLNRDPSFFSGMENLYEGMVHPYLIKYVILYYDHDFYGDAWDARMREFVREHRSYRRVSVARSAVGAEEACKIFGISPEECKKLGRRDLARLYRQKAKEAHPDKGGDHETFVKIKDAYESLMRRK